jgi:prolyl-tRNA synthetase
MTHSDDNGLVVPPKVAPVHVVILPIAHKEEHKENILNYCDALAKDLRALHYAGRPVVVRIDNRELTGGEKAWSWVKKGVPLRVEVGMKEFENNAVYVGRRDKEYKDKVSVPRSDFIATLTQELDALQDNLLQRARDFQKQNTREIHSEKELYDFFKGDGGGFALAFWNGNQEVEAKIKKDLNVTIRCIPIKKDGKGVTWNQTGTCIFSGEKDVHQVVFARAY